MTDLHQLEKESLLTAMRTTKNKRLYERYQAVYLYLQNYSKTEIASMIGRSERTIYSYNAYKAKGLSGLIMGRSTG
ncbi:TPA: helix-turn-helix domain-containing protein, partial [Bacillus cereus]|nr:helix-turn-helix domain-containing protein [Bacillus cereus]